MKLFWSTSSPFARKARVVLREKDLLDRVEEVECNPYADPAELRAANPLGRIPTLLLPSGEALYDSPVICAYLDALTRRRRLILSGPAQWVVRRAEALADGLLDLAVGITVELRRPAAEQSPASIGRWQQACIAATAEMERALATLPARLTLGHIAIACACGYLDFRPASVGQPWRDANPGLADWYAAFAARPSLVETRPDDGSYERFAATALTSAPKPDRTQTARQRLPGLRRLPLQHRATHRSRHMNAQPSAPNPTGANAFELRFESLFDSGRALCFPCDELGRVDLDQLGDRARVNYCYARATIGREFAFPALCSRVIH